MAIDYENYIISHHTETVYRIPMYPAEVNDALQAVFQSTAILARSAPLQSWASSGPRTLSFSLKVHRDLDYEGLTKEQIEQGTRVGDINKLMDEYQSLTLPNYINPMLVIPPKITVRLGKGLRITGVPTISLVHNLPIDNDGVYQIGVFQFEIKELTPYDAVEVQTTLHNARGKSSL